MYIHIYKSCYGAVIFGSKSALCFACSPILEPRYPPYFKIKNKINARTTNTITARTTVSNERETAFLFILSAGNSRT